MATRTTTGTLRVAVTQHEPVWLDLQGTVKKTCTIIEEAAGKGAKLVAFPEMWIPGSSLHSLRSLTSQLLLTSLGYPGWIWCLRNAHVPRNTLLTDCVLQVSPN